MDTNKIFQSTLPAWGETATASICNYVMYNFNPLSPHGERLRLAEIQAPLAYFNPLSPHGERPSVLSRRSTSRSISIHSPRMGRDRIGPDRRDHSAISIHSPRMGRDLLLMATCGLRRGISIHSPRMGRDRRSRHAASLLSYFNPLSPHGERRQVHRGDQPGTDFNPLSPHGERRCSWRLRPGTDWKFQSTLPAWGET